MCCYFEASLFLRLKRKLGICDVFLRNGAVFIVFFNADELSAGYLRRDACATASRKRGEYSVIGVSKLARAAGRYLYVGLETKPWRRQWRTLNGISKAEIFPTAIARTVALASSTRFLPTAIVRRLSGS
jgi:hypothetical protein